MRQLIFYFIIVLIISCDKNDAIFLSLDIHLAFVNQNGEDLLDSSKENSYKAKDINIYYLIDNNKVRAYDANMEHPEQFYVKYDDFKNKYILTLYVSEHLDQNNRSITFLELKANETDTIECEFIVKGASKYYSKVWYNGVLSDLNESNSYTEIEK